MLPPILWFPEDDFEAEGAGSDVSLLICSCQRGAVSGGALLCSRLEEGVWSGQGMVSMPGSPWQGALLCPLSSVSPPLVPDSHLSARHLCLPQPQSHKVPLLLFLVGERPARGTRADDSHSSLERSWDQPGPGVGGQGRGAGCSDGLETTALCVPSRHKAIPNEAMLNAHTMIVCSTKQKVVFIDCFACKF